MAGEKAPWHSLRRRCKATGLSPSHARLQRRAAHTPDTLIQLQRSIRSTFAGTTRALELPARDFSLAEISPDRTGDFLRRSQSHKNVFSRSFTPTKMTRRVVNVENLKEDPLRSHEAMLKANDQS